MGLRLFLFGNEGLPIVVSWRLTFKGISHPGTDVLMPVLYAGLVNRLALHCWRGRRVGLCLTLVLDVSGRLISTSLFLEPL